MHCVLLYPKGAWCMATWIRICVTRTRISAEYMRKPYRGKLLTLSFYYLLHMCAVGGERKEKAIARCKRSMMRSRGRLLPLELGNEFTTRKYILTVWTIAMRLMPNMRTLRFTLPSRELSLVFPPIVRISRFCTVLSLKHVSWFSHFGNVHLLPKSMWLTQRDDKKDRLYIYKHIKQLRHSNKHNKKKNYIYFLDRTRIIRCATLLYPGARLRLMKERSVRREGVFEWQWN